MGRKRASMREGPLADLFRSTEESVSDDEVKITATNGGSAGATRVEIEGILPTMLDSRTVHAKEAVEILEENFGELVFKSRIRKAIKFAEAPVRGSSVLKYDPNSNAANYYRELAKEVLTNGTS